jgi:hypothetical protein
VSDRVAVDRLADRAAAKVSARAKALKANLARRKAAARTPPPDAAE